MEVTREAGRLDGDRSVEWSGFGADIGNYDVAPDGSRFLVARRKNPLTATVIDVVLKWREKLSTSTSPSSSQQQTTS